MRIVRSTRVTTEDPFPLRNLRGPLLRKDLSRGNLNSSPVFCRVDLRLLPLRSHQAMATIPTTDRNQSANPMFESTNPNGKIMMGLEPSAARKLVRALIIISCGQHTSRMVSVNDGAGFISITWLIGTVALVLGSASRL